MGWVSYLNRAATTNYLCCGQALEDSLGAGRIGLTHNLCKDSAFFVISKKYERFFCVASILFYNLQLAVAYIGFCSYAYGTQYIFEYFDFFINRKFFTVYH